MIPPYNHIFVLTVEIGVKLLSYGTWNDKIKCKILESI